MAEEKNQVMVETYDLAMTERKDDRFGRVVTSKSLNEDDLIRIAVQRRTDLSPTSLKSTIELLKEIARENIANGASVAFGLGYFSVGVNGVFLGDDPRWEPDVHSLVVKVIPSAELRNSVKSSIVNIRGNANIGTAINKVTDVTTDEINSVLTPGGAVNLIGSRIRVIGEHESNGIFLVNQATNEVVAIPKTSIATNDPSKVTFVMPANIPTGDYILQITTQYSNTSTLLKEPRTYSFNYVLAVG